MPTSHTTAPPPRWLRSLYWRMALGLALTVALTIAVQAAVVFYLLSRGGPSPGLPPPGFTRLVASDLARALEEDRRLDLSAFVREEYGDRLFPFVVVLRDGRATNHEGGGVPEPLLRQARRILDRRPPGLSPLDAGPADDDDRPDALSSRPRRVGPRPGVGLGGPFAGRGGPGDGRRPALIQVGSEVTGVVLALPQTLTRRYGPTLALTGTAALILATVLASLAVLGPVRRRLADLERAAQAVESGDLSARAGEEGADEVAGLARAFNRMASRLDERARELAAHERARRLLLADISHELSTPLTSMRGYLETLAIPGAAVDQASRDRYLQIVSDETHRLEAIVGDLLDLARLEAGGSAMAVDDVAVESLFGAVEARHDRVASAAGVTLRSSIEAGAEILRGDARRLEQALQNLVANALRHTPGGGSVTLESRREGTHVVLSVRDTGEGIAPEHLPHLFDRFYKVETARGTAARGSGLGLSIVKAIVDRHGGTVNVASSFAGTTFELRLPAGDE